MGRFETEILTIRKNLKGMMDLPGNWIDRAGQHRAFDKLILDLDSSVSETYGRRERADQWRGAKQSVHCIWLFCRPWSKGDLGNNRPVDALDK